MQGLRVIDLTEYMAGPFCTMVLADMGAEVVKVERPGKGDSTRAMGNGSERNPYFLYINRNKKSVTLDYKASAGREVFLKLVGTADILVENYRPTVMTRAGLGWDASRGTQPAADLCAAHRIWRRRSLQREGRLGPYRPRHGRDHARDRRARRTADIGRAAHL